MALLTLAMVIYLVTGLAALFCARAPRLASAFGVGGAVTGGLLGLIPTLQVLAGVKLEPLRYVWAVPFGELYLEIDPLSAFFLVPTLVLPAVAAIYGSEYLESLRTKRSLGAPWFFFNVLIAALVVVVTARNAVLFLVAWEVMSLSSYFLMTFEDEKLEVREAGWTYLVATHMGTAFMMVMFVLLGQQGGSLNFDQFGGALAPSLAGLLFVLAVIGFGTKAGLVPMHVWLPDAYPAAPSFVAAVMTGVMSKMGIYGILRVLTFLGAPAAWWGELLIGIGLLSGILGIIFALTQPDLNRLLAYSSIENLGIVAIGLGVGLLGRYAGSSRIEVMGFTGALLHVLNHSAFKGLLFLGAGAVSGATGTDRLEALGGLLKRMPRTGLLFLVGAVAICGLPALNGFVSEFLIYWGAVNGVASLWAAGVVWMLAVMGGLALIGGLAAATFARAFGMAFLGEPRSEKVAYASDPGRRMRFAMGFLALACLAIMLTSPWLIGSIAPVVAQVGALDAGAMSEPIELVQGRLMQIVVAMVLFAALLGCLALLRRRLLAGREVGEAGTWDCGYARPTARMQYTGSSFAQPLSDVFGAFLRSRRDVRRPEGLFPTGASLSTETPDVFREQVYRPVFRRLARGFDRLHILQQGRVQLYVLYIAITLITLMIWELG